MVGAADTAREAVAGKSSDAGADNMVGAAGCSGVQRGAADTAREAACRVSHRRKQKSWACGAVQQGKGEGEGEGEYGTHFGLQYLGPHGMGLHLQMKRKRVF